MAAPPITYLQPYVNLLPGDNVTIEIDQSPDGGDNEITISATGGGAVDAADVTYSGVEEADDVAEAIDNIATRSSNNASELNNHEVDATDAHDASAISVDSTTLVGTGVNVQAVFEELDDAVAASVLKATAQTTVLVAATFVGAPPANGNYMAVQVPVACTVTAVRGHFKGGTNAVINARKNQTSNFLSSNLTVSTANAWADGGTVQNTSLAVDDDIELMIVSTSGAVTEISIEVIGTRVLA